MRNFKCIDCNLQMKGAARLNAREQISSTRGLNCSHSEYSVVYIGVVAVPCIDYCSSRLLYSSIFVVVILGLFYRISFQISLEYLFILVLAVYISFESLLCL